MVFGSTSANTSTTKVSTPVAIATPASPYRRMPTMVPSAEARMLTRLLPISTRLIRRSRLAQQLLHALGGAVALFRHVAQPVAVQRHHAGFGTGEIGRDNHHDDQRYDQRGGGDMFHVGFLKRLSSRTAAARGYQNRPASANRRQRR